MSLYLFQLIEPSTSINRKSYRKFFKNWFSIETNTFSKSSLPFLSPYDSVKAQSQIFFRFRPFFLQGFPLPRPVRPLYPSLCFYFHVFMHKLMHFVGIFGPFQIWDFCSIKLLFSEIDHWVLFLYCYIHDICWLIRSIWGFVKNWKF